MRRFIRDWLFHRFNSVHVYCRLLDCGIPGKCARRVSAAWERVYRRPRVAGVPIGGNDGR